MTNTMNRRNAMIGLAALSSATATAALSLTRPAEAAFDHKLETIILELESEGVVSTLMIKDGIPRYLQTYWETLGDVQVDRLRSLRSTESLRVQRHLIATGRVHHYSTLKDPAFKKKWLIPL